MHAHSQMASNAHETKMLIHQQWIHKIWEDSLINLFSIHQAHQVLLFTFNSLMAFCTSVGKILLQKGKTEEVGKHSKDKVLMKQIGTAS